jgi:hypothetical protein
VAGLYSIGAIMKRNDVLKILNAVLVVLSINQAATVLFLGKLSREAFQVLHKGGGSVLIILIIVHLLLNLNWIKASYFTK